MSIAPDPDHQPYTAIAIKPAVDLDRVEEVLVVTGYRPDVPAAAQQDLAAAEAQHAADISAEKLPSLHDDQPQNGGNGTQQATPAVAGVAQSAKVPHPLPTVHPDKYSTGSTPPAAELTPGARITDPAASAKETAPQQKPAPANKQAASSSEETQ
jgi:rod shape-determining protein MreC